MRFVQVMIVYSVNPPIAKSFHFSYNQDRGGNVPSVADNENEKREEKKYENWIYWTWNHGKAYGKEPGKGRS